MKKKSNSIDVLSEAKNFITSCYIALLGREPEPSGLEYYVELFLETRDYKTILDAFSKSIEFKKRHFALTCLCEGSVSDYYYFFHIPKTAGLTVKSYLSSMLGESQHLLFPGVFLKDLLNDIDAAKKHRFFSGHFLGFLDSLIGVVTHKATILRDPIDRTISYYFHLLRDPSLPLHEAIKGRSLRDVLSDDAVNGFSINYQAKYLAALVDDQGWLEHTLYYRSSPKSDQELLDKAKAGLAMIEVVGLQEDIKPFLKRLSEQWLINYSHSVPTINVGTNRDDRKFKFSDLEMIREMNNVDYAIYEYVRNCLHNKNV